MQCLVMCNLLSAARTLREVLAMAVRMALPSSLADPFATNIEDRSLYSLPSTSTISRWRLLLDAAFMLHRRRRFREHACIHVVQVDSSPQGGRDY